MRGLHLSALFTALSLMLVGAACDPGDEPDEHAQFESNGGQNFTVSTVSGCRRAVPNAGSDNPIVTWGNGTFGTPGVYTGLLNLWASHGLITTASTSSFTGSGNEMRACLNEAESLTTSDLAGASGHSQGGGGALCAAEDDSDIDTTALVQPDIVFTTNCDAREQTADLLYLCGSSDLLAPCATNGEAIWAQADVPAFWADRSGAGHFEPIGSGTNDYSGITTAWFTYKLKPGSPRWADAASLFQGSDCGYCDWGVWDTRRKNNP